MSIQDNYTRYHKWNISIAERSVKKLLLKKVNFKKYTVSQRK